MMTAALPMGLLVLAGAVLFACAPDSEKESQSFTPYNVILISLDTLRADHLGCYGYERETSPNLDAFAKQAVFFENSICHAPSTLPSHVSIFTSSIPSHHKMSHTLGTKLTDATPTMASILKAKGYDTISFNNGGQLDAAYGVDVGFDRYTTLTGKEDLMEIKFFTMVNKAREWITTERKGDKPFFLFLHTYETHISYLPFTKYLKEFEDEYPGSLPIEVLDGAAEDLHRKVHERKDRTRTSDDGSIVIQGDRFYRTANIDVIFAMLIENINAGRIDITDGDLQHIVNAYDASIRSVDDAFGGLIQYLKEAGLYDNTLIVVTSDHGEEFNERGNIAVHGSTLFEELIHVPLIIKLPEDRYAGKTVKHLAAGIDLLPTMTDVLGIEPLDTFEGRSLIPLIDTVEDKPHLILTEIIERDKSITTAVRTPRWKLFRDKLYDIENDPMETTDLSDKYPEVKRSLEKYREEMLQKEYHQWEYGEADVDPELERQLKELGY